MGSCLGVSTGAEAVSRKAVSKEAKAPYRGFRGAAFLALFSLWLIKGTERIKEPRPALQDRFRACRFDSNPKAETSLPKRKFCYFSVFNHGT